MNKSKVLIVEDHPITARDLQKALERLDFHITDNVSSYELAMESIKLNEPQIIMMDINLGDGKKSGIELARDIHRLKYIPVIYLTAFSDEETMEDAFTTDPVGYLIKPFKREEVKAAIMLALYKLNKLDYKNINEDHSYIGFGYYFDIKNKKLYYKSKYIKLGQKERILIDTMVRAEGKTVSNQELENKLWSDKAPSLSSLRTLIYRLKTKLGCQLILACYSNGYKLAPII
ncbi:MAG: response regulator [Campylobacterota bacterium]|nr:response regulator [Campylobacterota bacterium]